MDLLVDILLYMLVGLAVTVLGAIWMLIILNTAQNIIKFTRAFMNPPVETEEEKD